MPEIITLESGWQHIRFSKADGFLDDRCFVQLPPAFVGDRIPNERIHEPEWNAERVNLWWAEHRAEAASA